MCCGSLINGGSLFGGVSGNMNSQRLYRCFIKAVECLDCHRHSWTILALVAGWRDERTAEVEMLGPPAVRMSSYSPGATRMTEPMFWTISQSRAFRSRKSFQKASESFLAVADDDTCRRNLCKRSQRITSSMTVFLICGAWRMI